MEGDRLLVTSDLSNDAIVLWYSTTPAPNKAFVTVQGLHVQNAMGVVFNLQRCVALKQKGNTLLEMKWFQGQAGERAVYYAHTNAARATDVFDYLHVLVHDADPLTADRAVCERGWCAEEAKPERLFSQLDLPLVCIDGPLVLNADWDVEHCRVYLRLFAAASTERTVHLRDNGDLVWLYLVRKEIANASFEEKAGVGGRAKQAPEPPSGDLMQSAVESVDDKAGKEVWDLWLLHGDRGLHRILGSTGGGVRVALLDSGIDAAHPDVRRQLRGFCSFVPGEPDAWLDPNGHGTYCAGILAAVAPDCELYVAKVLRDDGAPSSVESLCEALHWAVDVARCKVISISAGTPSYSAELCAAINHAIDGGAIVLCAAANYGRLHSSNIAYPGAFGNTICVGSHDEKGQVSHFSSAGREVDFLAPGETVLAAESGTGSRAAVRGTSMAVPFAAGLAALLAGCVHERLHRELDNESMRMLMRKLCTSPGTHDDARGYGLLKPMEQLRVQGVDYINKWAKDIFTRDEGMTATKLSDDVVKKAMTMAGCTDAPSKAAPLEGSLRVKYFTAVALIEWGKLKDKLTDKLRKLTCGHDKELVAAVAAALQDEEGAKSEALQDHFKEKLTSCKSCKAAIKSVIALDGCDRVMICHFLNHADLHDSAPGNMPENKDVHFMWERLVCDLIFGNFGKGDDLGCWLHGRSPDAKFYCWPKMCRCPAAVQRLAESKGAPKNDEQVEPCPFWSDGVVEYAKSAIPLKHMGIAGILSTYGIVDELQSLHHPVLCEVNKSAKMKLGPVAHTCFRPSHLMCGTSVTNKLHEKMNQLVSHAHNNATPSLEWISKFVSNEKHNWAPARAPATNNDDDDDAVRNGKKKTKKKKKQSEAQVN
ncbi:MAG: S8 family serine peptidase [Myxococcales bacterium]|nr:S8 family serine peptidase [Myxococcales bacterium]